MRDPHNIPRSWEIDANQAHHTFRRYGLVNKYCTKKLLKGEGCLDNKCESAMVTDISKFVKGAVEGSYAAKYRGDGYVKLNSCDELVRVKMSWQRKRICKGSGLKESDLVIPSHCKIKKEL